MKIPNWLIVAGGAFAVLYFAAKKFVDEITFTINSINISFRSLTPVLNLGVLIKNNSFIQLNLSGLSGIVYYGDTVLGNYISTDNIQIKPNEIKQYNIQVDLSLTSTVSELISLIQKGGVSLKPLIFTGSVMVNGVSIPFTTNYSL